MIWPYVFVSLALLFYVSVKAFERWSARELARRYRTRLLVCARERVLYDRMRAGRWFDAVEGLIRAVNRSEPPEVSK